MTKTPVRFDDSLPILAREVAAELGDAALSAGTVLRDAVGRLAFFANTRLPQESVDRLSKRLQEELGAYARTDRIVAQADDHGAEAVRYDPLVLQIIVDAHRIRLLDRRLVGSDWLRKPAPPAPVPVRFVFASLKGGVGRSTALSVVAAHLAGRGQRVLAVDLDMEAPGLGSVLLSSETLPEYGFIDALVENGLSSLDETFFMDLVGPSALSGQSGRIDVLPAFGRRSLSNPADVLAKLSRAYTEDLRPDGTVATILDQVRVVVDHFATPDRYDVILIDARAGLHETTASSILGLGAEILLFGLDEPQTFQGYAALLTHLGRFIPPDGPRPEWVDRLTMVQGKAPTDADERADFRQRCLKLFTEAGLSPRPPEPATEVPLPAGPFSKVLWDDDLPDEEVLPADKGPREPLAVLDDSRFQRFDPQRRRDLLSEAIYGAAYGALIDRIERALRAEEQATP
ncbi:AAA family ATPase [Myxococcaceae bacterium GXIMD 01537]